MASDLTHRLARRDDLDALRRLMDAAISQLQKPFLNDEQIASSRTIMGLDTQLIDDGTYFVVECGGELAGCGGWSRRATLYGGDQSPGRSPAPLDPARDAARIRAMYTHPHHARKGVGRLILSLCETAAAHEGFGRAELMATLAGEPLYRACGYESVERLADDRGGASVPLVRMGKALRSEDAVESIVRYVPLSHTLATAGQPSQAQLAAVAQAGFEVVVNLALHDDPNHSLPDEAATVRGLGMEYVHIPVQFKSPTQEDLASFFAAMEQAGDRKVLVHCVHNKRVPVFVALYRTLRQGWTEADALAAMQQVWEPDETWKSFIAAALARRHPR